MPTLLELVDLHAQAVSAASSSWMASEGKSARADRARLRAAIEARLTAGTPVADRGARWQAEVALAALDDEGIVAQAADALRDDMFSLALSADVRNLDAAGRRDIARTVLRSLGNGYSS